MKNQVLSIEQMQHLQNLSVDTSKAKMAYYAIYETLPNWYNELRIRDDIFDKNYPSVPTFTLQEMLEVIRENSDDNRIDINITTGFFETWKIYVEIYHKHLKPNQVEIFEHQDLLPCVYDVFCWLAENNYIGGKNEKRD